MGNIKKIVLLIGICFMISSTASAQSIVVDGVGADKNSAVRDAMRNAVAAVVGTFIDSRTLVENSVATLDEIYAKSQGFVKKVDIMNETTVDSAYRIKARVEVDTNPDAQLMSRLNMLMLLNDPRIAVVVKKMSPSTEDSYGETQLQFDNVSETSINDALLGAGFSHVVDTQIVAQLRNSQILSNIYNGTNEMVSENGSFGIDYLVLGTSSVFANKISLPNKEGTYIDTPLSTGKAEINVKIIKFDTGEIVETFRVEGQGVDNGDIFAQNKALGNAAEKISAKIEEKFKKIAAKTFDGITLTVRVTDDTQIDQFMNDLRTVNGIENVYLREKNTDKVIIEVESEQKAHLLMRRLKETTSLNIFVEEVAGSSASIVIS